MMATSKVRVPGGHNSVVLVCGIAVNEIVTIFIIDKIIIRRKDVGRDEGIPINTDGNIVQNIYTTILATNTIGNASGTCVIPGGRP